MQFSSWSSQRILKFIVRLLWLGGLLRPLPWFWNARDLQMSNWKALFLPASILVQIKVQVETLTFNFRSFQRIIKFIAWLLRLDGILWSLPWFCSSSSVSMVWLGGQDEEPVGGRCTLP